VHAPHPLLPCTCARTISTSALQLCTHHIHFCLAPVHAPYPPLPCTCARTTSTSALHLCTHHIHLCLAPVHAPHPLLHHIHLCLAPVHAPHLPLPCNCARTISTNFDTQQHKIIGMHSKHLHNCVHAPYPPLKTLIHSCTKKQACTASIFTTVCTHHIHL